ncbi:MarR family winged helix-turn-helix transcriptional regulator [Larkinella soli]|uniref:MarR family winged helix-turn-helix transcriptional regulator n=1 Tax=Larkinella soli TaxID=1770527 RepID=UPI000FFC6D66|nr:MarR family winged helix-turn-helix transcriptional regulator [Larkinella soli]
MKKYGIIQELISYLQAYEDQTRADRQTLFHFIAWMNGQMVDKAMANPHPEAPGQTSTESPDVQLGILVGFLNRYSRLYSKKALDDTPLVTLDDFTYLAALWSSQPMTKTALIERNVHEKTTGTEIIRRLIAHGLVEQYDDEVDKRSKRLKLTDAGVGLLMRLWPVMGQVASLMGGNLTVSEKMTLVSLLQKLHLFHNSIFLEQREEPLDALIAAWLNSGKGGNGKAE